MKLISRRGARLAAALIWMVGLAAPAGAADVKLTGLIFGQYAHYISAKDSSDNTVRGKSEFDITRIYMNAEGKFSPKLKGKIVLEGNSNTATDTGHKSNPVFVKNAFGEYMFHDLVSGTFGMIPTPWIGNEEGIWGRRFVQKTYLDQQSVFASADKGVGVLAKLPKGYGDFHAVYVNGEGYNNLETGTNGTGTQNGNGRYKDVTARLTVVPLPEHELLSGIKMHGAVTQGQVQFGDARRRDRYAGGASYQHGMGHLMFSLARSVDGNGTRNINTNAYSLHGSLRPIKSFKDASIFARHDFFSKAATGATAATSTDSFTRGIVGVDYKVSEGFRVSVNNQWLKPLTKNNARPKHYESILYTQFELKF